MQEKELKMFNRSSYLWADYEILSVMLVVRRRYVLSLVSPHMLRALLNYGADADVFRFFHLKECRSLKSNWHQQVFFSLLMFSVFCFPGILTMSTPWMTGARPSVGCKCRSYNSWSCRYCLSAFVLAQIFMCLLLPTLPERQSCLIAAAAARGSGVEKKKNLKKGKGQQSEIIFVHLQVTSH